MSYLSYIRASQARVLRHPAVLEWVVGWGHFSSGCKKLLPFPSVYSVAGIILLLTD